MIPKWNFYNVSDSEKKILQLVGIWSAIYTCKILKKSFYNVSDFYLQSIISSDVKIYPMSTSCTFFHVFFHTAMGNYSLRFLQLDSSIRRSHKSPCTHFNRDSDFFPLSCTAFFSVWTWYMQKVAASFINVN